MRYKCVSATRALANFQFWWMSFILPKLFIVWKRFFSNFSLDGKQEICHQIRLRGDNDLFLPNRKKRTRDHPFAYVDVHISCKMMHGRDA